MNKKFFALLIALFIIVGSAFYASPAAAYTGIEITVINSKTLTEWTYGGDVYVLNGSGDIVATGSLDGNGELTLSYGTDALSVCGGPCATASGTISVVIDFTCSTSGNSCNPPVGTPSTNSDMTYTEIVALSFNYTDTVRTGTGPTAVAYSSMGAGISSSTISPFVFVALLLSGVSFIVLRRRDLNTSLDEAGIILESD